MSPAISRRCAACSQQVPAGRTLYCGTCLCECGRGPIAVKDKCRRCYGAESKARWRYRKDSPEYAAIQRDLWEDRFGQPHWTKERIIAVMQRWAQQHDGRSPSLNQWSHPGRDYAGPQFGYRRSSRPSVGAIRRVFGSWSAAIAAAGLESNPVGSPLRERCKRGHPFTLENTVREPDGKRMCRICRNASARRRWKAKAK